MNRRMIAALLALVLLLAGAGVGVVLVKSNLGFAPKATPETTPRQVRITNLTSNDFVVSWITTNPVTGFLKYGTDESSLDHSASDNRDKLTGDTNVYRTHYVTVTDLEPETDYYFKIGSENLLYDRNGQAFNITTPAILGTPTDFKVYGKVLNPAQTPAEGAIVYVTLSGATPLSGLVESNGNYLIPISTARSLDLKNYALFDPTTTPMSVVVETGRDEATKIAATTGNSQPIPDIVLGQNLLNSDSQVVATSQTFPTATPIPTAQPTTSISSISIDEIPVDQTILYTQKPQFNGSAPPNVTLQITIHSSSIYTGEVATDASGTWSYQVPDNLEPGSHTLTIAYLDTNGITQQISRTFVVQASETSNSGQYGSTTNLVPTTTPTPTLIVPVRTYNPETTHAMPVSGSTSQTLTLIFLGLSCIVSALIITKKYI